VAGPREQLSASGSGATLLGSSRRRADPRARAELRRRREGLRAKGIGGA
jgi:hypothetical protein